MARPKEGRGAVKRSFGKSEVKSHYDEDRGMSCGQLREEVMATAQGVASMGGAETGQSVPKKPKRN